MSTRPRRHRRPQGETIVPILAPPKFEDPHEPLNDLVYRLQQYFLDIIDIPLTFDQLRTTKYSGRIKPLINTLADDCHHPAIVAALMCCKAIFASDDDDRGINEGRGFAAELVAWRFLTHLGQGEIIDYLCYELPPIPEEDDRHSIDSSTPILPLAQQANLDENAQNEYIGLNTLELAVVCNAKKFLSQNNVQRVVNGIWDGNIIFWESLRDGEVKKARIYNKRKADPYCRLRIPKYQKVFEALFLVMFLVLYYAVLMQRDVDGITVVEVCLYLMFVSFAYDEVSQVFDAGTLFYAADIFSWVDAIILLIFLAFLICRIIGLVKHDHAFTNASFDILSLEALLLMPRIFSLISLTRFFGTLVPALKSMSREFMKFITLVAILYLGFLTTFSALGRQTFTFRQMSWMLVKIFFGSSYIGFDNMASISPVLGAPLMIFVTMTNILLVTAMISLLSNSLSEVINNSKEEYLFMFSTYVLEASTSNRLTYFTPPFNLIALAVRPLRLCLPASKLRMLRIWLLKITHLPLVVAIVLYEKYWRMDPASEEAKRRLYSSKAPSSPRISSIYGAHKPDSSIKTAKYWKRAFLGSQAYLPENGTKGKNIGLPDTRDSREDLVPMTPAVPLTPGDSYLHHNRESMHGDFALVTHEDLKEQMEILTQSFMQKMDEVVQAVKEKDKYQD